MTSNVEAKLITGDELAEMGDIGRCELVEGEIIMKNPAGWQHGMIEWRIGQVLGNFVDEHGLGQVMTGEVGLYIRRNPDTVRGADVMFISHARLAQVKSPSFLDVAPEMVVEVMSPDDRWTEVKRKLGEYFAIGVIVVWVTDPSDNTVSVYRSLTDIKIVGEGDLLDGGDVLPGFEVAVASLFGGNM
ncbi:MAG: Uma2 family endonuclease [Anaerolineae bacterium]